ncbi:hypothetical protein GGR56DRAFT_143210 [Xylariaceae sp. FL0804]|nr:hypothetical protein GGR56DRAFT_143210 [Xylariaceae sp. FL0804]
MADAAAIDTGRQEPWFLRYSFPVDFPSHAGFDLSLSQDQFEKLVGDAVRLPGKKDSLEGAGVQDDYVQDDHAVQDDHDIQDDHNASSTISSSTAHEARLAVDEMDLDAETETETLAGESGVPTHPFIDGLLAPFAADPDITSNNKMLTENHDLAYRSTTQPLLDLFAELEDVVSSRRLSKLLAAAWAEDPLMTLKLIYNARSIHIGKASRLTFYRCAGWLAQDHPLTLIANLRWLCRPVIEKKAEKKEDGNGDDEFVSVEQPDMVDEDEDEEGDPARFDVQNGVSHGYWKDLLNLLALCVNGKLRVGADPRAVLNVQQEVEYEGSRRKQRRFVEPEAARARRHARRDARYARAVEAFDTRGVYRGLHLAVARLFAEQLRADLALLRGGDDDDGEEEDAGSKASRSKKKKKNNISLCAKWAPSHDRFHDRHTFVVSSIAEMLHPMADVVATITGTGTGTGTGGDGSNSSTMDRALYLRHARELYRRDVSALRAHLDVTERHLAARTLDRIKYERVPSVAMSRYAHIFGARDGERFASYLDGVAEGKLRISGATLLPSHLVRDVLVLDERIADGDDDDDYDRSWYSYESGSQEKKRKAPKLAVEARLARLRARVADAQWAALARRVRDNGGLASSIAVCDVSGSMYEPTFADGTVPVHSAIGLSLLVAEVTAPPFGGHFITFSAEPEVQSVDPAAPLHDRIDTLNSAQFGYNTDFVAVFERLILPMALRHRLAPEDMVKRVFVFSDMQFDDAAGCAGASSSSCSWSTSFERIRGKYAEAGYEMPELVFWNLAGGRAGYQDRDQRGSSDGSSDAGGGDAAVAPKPVTADEPGCAIVSGYSQGMLKVFLDSGSFEDPEAEEEEDEAEPEITVTELVDGEIAVLERAARKKRKMDPMAVLRKAVGHKAYDPLKVVD